MRLFLFSLLPICFFITFLNEMTAHSRYLQGRLGLGFEQNVAALSTLPNTVPAISLKYALDRTLSIGALVGISTASPSYSLIGGKLYKNVFFEMNLNFYFFTMGAFRSANHRSGFELQGGFGVEFFFPGMESLGFSMETGMSASNITGSFALETLGASFIHAGMHFYF